ncbi:MAG: M48 family metallopeptidase [Alteromonadaceae bacterium]|nr:M48 family metallopeptidase [Alteromonadaceae bacterium]
MFKLKPFVIASLLPTVLATVLATPLATAQEQNKNKLPEIGTAGFSTLSIDKERLIGHAMMRQVRASQPVINDPVLNEYINDLGNKLVKNAEDVNYAFEFFFINSTELNAFAFFGGHIAIHSGLLTTAANESELAAVIAHEISHVTQRHLARRLEAQNNARTLTTAGMISSILLTLVNPTVGMAALSTTMAATQQNNINYTRGNEKEADRVGIKLLANSGFDPMGAPNFFRTLANKFRYTSKPPAMLLTHPLPDSRISDARVRAQNLPQRAIQPQLQFELAKARITARYEGNPSDNVIIFKNKVKKLNYNLKPAAQYGLALSYFENKEFEAAKKLLELLHKNDENNLFYVDTLSDVYIQTKDFTQAIEMLSKLNLLMPNNQVVTLNYANVLYEAKKYQQAEILLQDFLLVKRGNFLAYDLLTSVYRKQNKTALMHTAKAEVLALHGAYTKAIDELHSGYNFAKKLPLVKKRIKGRIVQFQAQADKLKRL